ncbi:MAG: hypothetical protein OHK0046_49190 [Anaerolineae bacterium]
MDYPVFQDEVPYLTTDQMREVDRIMIEDYHIELIQMMENAGRSLAHLAKDRFLQGDPRGKRVVVLAGTGGNGGGAMVSARRLQNYGASVHVFLSRPELDGVPAHQRDILRRMNIPVLNVVPDTVIEPLTVDLIIDGIIGYSLKGAPRGLSAEFIDWANASGVPILALDTPSGLDTSTGTAHTPTIHAAATLTLALPKVGLRSAAQVGELYVADLSVPPALYADLGLQIGPIFAQNDILRIR